MVVQVKVYHSHVGVGYRSRGGREVASQRFMVAGRGGCSSKFITAHVATVSVGYRSGGGGWGGKIHGRRGGGYRSKLHDQLWCRSKFIAANVGAVNIVAAKGGGAGRNLF